ncbi:MAG: hypothetical protein JRJ79_17170 [Deltaproteobacteria bacterium]|nr:hypothetical protein [Deltaproteobacteria bacterium]
MSVPKLNLDPFYCDKLEVWEWAEVDVEGLKVIAELLDTKKLVEDSPHVLYTNYTTKKVKHTIWMMLGATKEKARGKYTVWTKILCEKGRTEHKGEARKGFDFEQVFQFLQDNTANPRGGAIFYFDFPQSRYKTVVELPYRRDDLLLDKRIEIRGLDLELDDGDTKYRQSVSVYDTEHVVQRVGFLELKEHLSSSGLKTLLQTAFDCAKELLYEKGTGDQPSK